MGNKYEIYEVEAEMFPANELYFPNKTVLILKWEAYNGFGEITYTYNRETKEWNCDTECMGREFCTAVFDKWMKTILNEN